MNIRHKKFNFLIFLQIKKDNKITFIINAKDKNKRLDCSAKQTSDCTQNS